MKNSGFSYLLVLGICSMLFSCRSLNYRIANNYYDQFAYSRAIPKYEKVLRKELEPNAARNLADSYRKTGNSLKSEFWYKRLLTMPSATEQDKLAMAEVLMENGKYEDAGDWFRKYIQLNGSDARAKRLLIACDSIHIFFEDSNAYSISLPGFNRENESNFSATFYKEGIVFLSDRPAPGKNKEKSLWTGREYLDLFFTSQIGGTDDWLEPELLKGNINGLYDEGPAVFDTSYTRIYFTRTDYAGKNVSKNEEDESVLKMYTGKLDNGNWNLESGIPFNNDEYSVGHPALTPDGNTLFFVSDMPWGYGGTDLYSSSFQNGNWSDPVNLGIRVNSEGNEMFPFFANDSTLYFASDGHIGLGGLDIYETTWNGEYWVTPTNLQYPVNSPKDDFGYIIDEEGVEGFFTSSRSISSDKIYSFIKHPPIILHKICVKDSKTGKQIKNYQAVIKSDSGSKNFKSDNNGEAKINLPDNSMIQLVIKANGYFSDISNFDTHSIKRSRTTTDTISLTKISNGKSMVCGNIYFDKKTTDLTESITYGLDSLYEIMIYNPELQIEIASHTDSRGSSSSNLEISRKRSDNMSLYLINKGIQPFRIISKGYGEYRLKNQCRNGILCLEEDHMVNNRVEVTVVDIID